MTQDYSIRYVAEAERLIAAGEVPSALDKLRMAAESVPWWWNQEDSAALIARIRRVAEGVARDAPSYVPQVQAIRDVLARRDRAGRAAAAAAEAEPWVYRAAELLAGAALLASALSVIGGIVVGIAASQSTTDGFTHHRGGVVFLGIVGGLFTAALWLGVAVGLNLLLDIGRTLRASNSQS